MRAGCATRPATRSATPGCLGGEFYPHPRLAVIAESFGDDKSTPYWQTGLRYSILPKLLQVDATTGQQYGGYSASRWLSLGLRWTPERLF